MLPLIIVYFLLHKIYYTVDLVIFACLDLSVFVILGFFQSEKLDEKEVLQKNIC